MAPLLLERRIHFDKKHNPYFQHATAQYWLALCGGEAVGRITAQIDALHLKQHGDATGHFGFIEAIDDARVFKALLDTAEAWLRAHGMRRSVGPVSFSMWDEPGLLVEGFDRPPAVLMGHALPYYEERITAHGYAGVQDLIAYDYQPQAPLPPHAQRFVNRALQRPEFRFRTIRMDRKHFAAEIELIRDILNDAWHDNWGFVPMTEAEIADLATVFRVLLPPDAVWITEYNGEPIGFSMVLPNLNEAIRDLNGHLLPLGFVKLLWRLKVRGLKSARLAMLGVRRKWWNTPVSAAVALVSIHKSKSSTIGRRITGSELSWILDTNESIKHVISLVGGTVYKRYRIFGKEIG